MNLSPMWTMPTGGANTGICGRPDGTFAIGDFENTQLIFADRFGTLIGTLALTGAPAGNTLQGVTYDASREHYWVGHYHATAGTIRRYDKAGALQQTITPGVGTPGPNGVVYDAANDWVLTAWGDNKIRAYSCTTGTLQETITIDSALVSGSGVVDGMCFDPDDATKLWVSMDGVLKVGKIARSTGAVITSWTCPASPEHLTFLDGDLYLCCDRQYHEAITGGNRVYRFTSAGAGKAIHMAAPSMAGAI